MMTYFSQDTEKEKVAALYVGPFIRAVMDEIGSLPDGYLAKIVEYAKKIIRDDGYVCQSYIGPCAAYVRAGGGLDLLACAAQVKQKGD